MLDSALYDALRKRAVDKGLSVSAAIAEAVRRFLSEPEPKRNVKLPIVPLKACKLPKHIDPNSSSQILGYLDEQDMIEHGIQKLR